MQFHRGRLIDHIVLEVEDIEEARGFYEAVLAVLGVPIDREGEDWFLADELLVREGVPNGNGLNLAFQAGDEDTVRAFFDVAIEAGGEEVATPAYDKRVHPNYFASAVRDRDGNVIEAVCHGPINRSAASVVVEPSTMAYFKGLL